MEQWKDIEGYEGSYMVSNQGRVKSLPRSMYNGKVNFMSAERILKPRIAKNKDHYATVSLRKDGKSTNKAIHRLVAEHFLPKEEGRTYVNHKDENKLNNWATNLEWVTPSENQNYRDNQKRKGAKRSVPVIGINKYTGKQVIIETAEQARQMGYNKATISKKCSEPTRTYKNMYWRKLTD